MTLTRSMTLCFSLAVAVAGFAQDLRPQPADPDRGDLAGICGGAWQEVEAAVEKLREHLETPGERWLEQGHDEGGEG